MRVCLIPLCAIWILSGCATSTPRGEWAPIPQSAMQQCRPVPPLKSGSHQEVETWITQRGFDYRDCSDGKNHLIEQVRLREKLLGVDSEPTNP